MAELLKRKVRQEMKTEAPPSLFFLTLTPGGDEGVNTREDARNSYVS